MAELDSILEKYTHNGTTGTGVVHGAAFIVLDKEGQTIYSNASGKLNFDDDSKPFAIDSVGWLASMTKLLTAVSIMQLVERGMIGLDDDLGTVMPQLANMDILKGFDDDGKPITTKQTKPMNLRHLLTHSSGLGYGNFDPDLMRWATAVGRPVPNGATFALNDITFPLKFEPGEDWLYGVGNDWAGRIVEALSHQPLGEYMDEHIFQPLGMQSTTFHMAKRPDLEARRAAVGMRSAPLQPLVAGADPLATVQTEASGGAGLYSSASDYAKVVGALVADRGALLKKKETFRELCRPQLADNAHLMAGFNGVMHDYCAPDYPYGLPANYALGGAVNLEDLPGRRRKGSMMWSGMANPHWWIDPESGIAAVLFTQVLPPGDKVVIDMYDELERAVYRGLKA